MKSLLVLSILFAVLAACTAADKNHEEREKMFKECQEQEKISDEDAQAFQSHKIPPKAKCLAACVYEKTGGIRDGKIEADTIKANFAKNRGENEKFNKAVDECKSLTNTDRCELAFQFMECMKNAHQKSSESSSSS